MVNCLIVGTVGLDNIKTPFGKVKEALGGSASYGSIAASFFCHPGIVSIVGKDFPKENFDFFKKKGVSIEGVDIKGKTFRWWGEYEENMDNRKTIEVKLNCLTLFDPKLSDEYKKANYLFLANTDPEMQLQVFNQVKNPKFVMMDTMDYWIKNSKKALYKMMSKSDALLLNESEAKLLFGTTSIVVAAKKAIKLGPKYVIIKKGENGALMLTKNGFFLSPAYPLDSVVDPTGAGDVFAGALIGYLAKTDKITEENIKKAIIYGSVIASLNAEGFSLKNLKKIDMKTIRKRYNALVKMSHI